MPDPSYFRDKADQCLRLARESTDPMLVQSLTELGLEYAARAAAIDGLMSGKDLEDE
jgi:hypothetical protein